MTTSDTTTRTHPDDAPVRQHRNAHLIELRATDWRCLICEHRFEVAADADLFMCGDDCTGKHAHEVEDAGREQGGVRS